MNNKTLKALKGNIKKWERIVDGKGDDKGRKNSPLCQLGFVDCWGTRAHPRACPVAEKSNNCLCADTPYADWIRHQTIKHGKVYKVFPYKVLCPTCKKLARKELNFLKSLLLKVEKK